MTIQVSVQEAIQKIKPGARIFLGSGAAVPKILAEGLVQHGAHLDQRTDTQGIASNVVLHLLTLGDLQYLSPQYQNRFRHVALFVGSNARRAVEEGRADFIPVFLSEIPKLLQTVLRPNVALVQTTEPNAQGEVSLGVSVDIVRSAIESADLVIAEQNKKMPWTYGDAVLPLSAFHYTIPVEYELPELCVEETNDVPKKIAAHVEPLIQDGSTLQMGIGSIPDAILRGLSKKLDLGVHTEMFSDGVMHLIQQGVITGKKKNLYPQQVVSSFLMGSKKLYDFVHHRADLLMLRSDYVNDPHVIATNDQMISINSALAVDLTGQVAADSLGFHVFSGIGGQVDFVRGASRAKGGRSIIALPSTAKKGEISRIQAHFETGTGVVTSRGDVHVVVTEYGIADLYGLSIRARTERLISIAHPDFRPQIAREARYPHSC